MPAAPTLSHNVAHRTSFYGRRRANSSGSSSTQSSHHRSQSGSSASNPVSASFSSTSQPSSSATSKTTSSSAQRSSSPLSKKQAAIAAAANAASKRLQQVNATTNAISTGPTAAKAKSSAAVTESLRQDTAALAAARAWLDEPEYQTDVVEHMHRMEGETTPCVDLMDAQPELRWYMRPYLVDFIVEIHQTFRLRPETLYLTMNIVDRYVSKRIVYKRHYQLVGCAALLIAAKFEDAKDKVPLVSELTQMCCNAYDESAFVQMEGHVLSTIGWILGYPTPEAWLRFACAKSNAQATTSSLPLAQAESMHILDTVVTTSMDAKTLNMARFLLELTLFTRDFIGLSPSHVTAGCLMLARIIAGNGANRDAITATAAAKAVQVAQMVDIYLIEHAHELSEILVKKYSFSHCAHASTAVVQWYAAFKAQQSIAATAAAPTLLPAVSFSSLLNRQAIGATTTANASSGSVAMVKSTSASSFSTPRRSAEDVQDEEDEEDVDDCMSMRSRSTTPSSMISTPSQMSTDGEHDEDDDEDEDEDADHTLDEDGEESDMPVTPLSLNSLHDPLVATESKENGSVGVAASSAVSVVKASSGGVNETSQHLQAHGDRRALSLSQQDNRLII